jgi:GNAT superfamily N-acetyltransferase
MEREIYSLKVYSTRMEYDSFQLELTPQENEADNDYYGMNFNVTLWCRGALCAKLWGKLYDENLVYKSAMDILNVADPMGKEEVALAEAFNDCPELCSKTKEWMDSQGFSGYVQGVFVQPEFRGRGIASYLLTHLDRILQHALHIAIRAVGVSPMPFTEMDGEITEDAEALARNRRILEKCGYHEIQDQSLQGMMYGNYDEEEPTGTGYFVRVYPA